MVHFADLQFRKVTLVAVWTADRRAEPLGRDGQLRPRDGRDR